MNDIIKLKESDIIRSHPRLTVISSKIVKKNPPMRELTWQEQINESSSALLQAFKELGDYVNGARSDQPYKAESISRADVLLAQKNHKMRMVRQRREQLLSTVINTALIGGTALMVFNLLIMAIEVLGA